MDHIFEHTLGKAGVFFEIIDDKRNQLFIDLIRGGILLVHIEFGNVDPVFGYRIIQIIP